MLFSEGPQWAHGWSSRLKRKDPGHLTVHLPGCGGPRAGTGGTTQPPLYSVEMRAGPETSAERACAGGVLECWTSNDSDESSENVPVNQRHGSSGDKCTSFEESYESLMFHKESEKNKQTML